MLEASIALPVLLLLLMGFIDFARLVTAQAFLIRGAHQALDAATKVAGFEASPAEAVTTKAAEYTAARTRILATAETLPLLMFGPITNSTGTRLLPWVMNSPGHPLHLTQSAAPASAAIIRPAERYTRTAVTGHAAITVNHITAPYPIQSYDISPAFQEALYNHPLMVRMQARFEFLFPLFPARLLSAQALGFREIYFGRRPTVLGPVTTVPYVSPTPPPAPTPTPTPPPATPVPATTTTTTVACGTPPACPGVGVYVNAACNCVCRPGKVQVEPASGTPPYCVEAGE